MTKTQRLARAMQNGQNFTANQIKNRFDIANPANAISTLRSEGYPIYSNRKVGDGGTVFTTYRIGMPTRRAFALAYEVLGAHGTGLVA